MISQVPDDAFENIIALLLSFHPHSSEPVQSEPAAKTPPKPNQTKKPPIKKPMPIQQTFQWSCPRQPVTLFRNGLTGENWCDGFPQLHRTGGTAQRN